MEASILGCDKEITSYHQARSSNNSDDDRIGQMLLCYREGMEYSMLETLRARGFGMEK